MSMDVRLDGETIPIRSDMLALMAVLMELQVVGGSLRQQLPDYGD